VALGQRETAIGAVLAGGRGRRIGGPKARVELGGRALVDYPLAAFRAAGLETVVVAKPSTDLPALDVPVWTEPEEPSHPLAGIVAALSRGARPVVACGCDMPFVPPVLLELLASADDPLVVPLYHGRLHPLVARYVPSLVGRLEEALGERRPLQETVRELEPRVLDETELRRVGDPERLLFNVNTRADLARAEAMLT
jgi:molybdopterin-guanine dinucleotide biosynthesis protein A